MRKGLIFQIIIAFILLTGWNILHFGFQKQQRKVYAKSSQVKMIIFAEDLNRLKDLEIDFEQVYYIDNVEIESDDIVAKALIENYDLGDVKDILVSYNLPNIMTVSFNGSHFRAKEKKEVIDFVKQNYPELNFAFDEILWQTSEDELISLQKNYLMVNLVFLVVFLFILIFLRIHFEIKHDEYWRIFKSAGGSYHKRNIEFIKDSIYLTLIPVGMVMGIYYFLIYREIINYKLDLTLFGIELAAIVLVSLVSRISLWSKF
jgi:hypothetical protein